MKKHACWLLIFGICLTGCGHSVDVSEAYNVAGLYQLIEYGSATTLDENLSGAISTSQIDKEHINILVKGTSGTPKLTYSYVNVLVLGAGQPSYTLLYKGHPISKAGNDGVSRYLTLHPTSSISLTLIWVLIRLIFRQLVRKKRSSPMSRRIQEIQPIKSRNLMKAGAMFLMRNSTRSGRSLNTPMLGLMGSRRC